MKDLDAQIRIRCLHIQGICFHLYVLEHQFFLLKYNKNITISGIKNSFIDRLNKEHLTSEISMRAIFNNFFLDLAKLFEPASRNRTHSIPNLIQLLKDNTHLFKTDKREHTSRFIFQYLTEIKKFDAHLNSIKEHRDKCLGHSDPKYGTCNHLNNITSKDTENILSTAVQFSENLSLIFEYPKFDQLELEIIKSRLTSDNFDKMQKMEN